MSKSLLYAANLTPQTTLSAGSIINFGEIVRRYGCNCNLTAGGNIAIDGLGYYKGEGNITLTANATGTVTLAWYKDGVAIPGAYQSKTVADGSVYDFNIPFVVREKCCCDDNSALTLVVSGAATTVTNAAAIVEKV